MTVTIDLKLNDRPFTGMRSPDKDSIVRSFSSDSAQKMPPPPPRRQLRATPVKQVMDKAKHTAALIWVFKHAKDCNDSQCEITGCFAAKKTLLNCIGESGPQRDAVRRKVDNLLNHEFFCGRSANGSKNGAKSCLVCGLLRRAKPLQFKRSRAESEPEKFHTSGGQTIAPQNSSKLTLASDSEECIKKRRSLSENDSQLCMDSDSSTQSALGQKLSPIWDRGEEEE